jgi:autophagy-related protein 9
MGRGCGRSSFRGLSTWGKSLSCDKLGTTTDPKYSQIIFVAVSVTFLTQCIDWPKIPRSKGLSEVIVPQCTQKISGMPNVAIWLFTLHVFWRIYQLMADIPHLLRVRDFYLYLLEIPESDMQTVSWQDVVARIMALRDANPVTVERISPANRRYLGSQSKQRLDAHDIANRLMRRENYLIALFNKEILDLTLNVPFLRGRQFFSKALLWNLDWCIMDLIFNENGQVRQLVLKDSHRRQLSDALRDRFLFSGFMNVLLAPIIISYLLVSYFFKYFSVSPSVLKPKSYLIVAGIPKESGSYWLQEIYSIS